MATPQTLLCIHREPGRLSLLQDKGYELVTASNGCEGLRLFMSRPVDAIVLEYYLGLLDGAVVAAEIKQIRPEVPIVMLAENIELPEGALKSVDALVTRTDGAHFLWATVHFVLNVKPAWHLQRTLPMQPPRQTLSRARGRDMRDYVPVNTARRATDRKDMPFSASEWNAIHNGRVSF